MIPKRRPSLRSCLMPNRTSADSFGIPEWLSECFNMANGGSFAMGTAIAVQSDYTSQELRGLASAGEGRRAAAATVGESRRPFTRRIGQNRRHGPADVAGSDDPVQSARWGGLVNRPSPGGPSKLTRTGGFFAHLSARPRALADRSERFVRAMNRGFRAGPTDLARARNQTLDRTGDFHEPRC
jgi:hypothetical protein